jgi:hypothetical protein
MDDRRQTVDEAENGLTTGTFPDQRKLPSTNHWNYVFISNLCLKETKFYALKRHGFFLDICTFAFS